MYSDLNHSFTHWFAFPLKEVEHFVSKVYTIIVVAIVRVVGSIISWHYAWMNVQGTWEKNFVDIASKNVEMMNDDLCTCVHEVSALLLLLLAIG